MSLPQWCLHHISVQISILVSHHAIGLQVDCMVGVPALVVRLLDSHMYTLWP